MDEQPNTPLLRRIAERQRLDRQWTTPGTATTVGERAQMRRALWKKGIPAGGWVDRALRGDLR